MKLSSALIRFALGYWVFASCVAKANQEETVISPVTGGQAYLIVHEDEAGVSQRAVGIYAREGTNWKMIVPGRTLVDSRRGPVIQQLAMGKIDPRLPMAAVVNGKLRLLTTMSNPENPDTFITIGEKPVAEIASGNLRLIPELSDSSQISMFQSELTLFDHRAAQLLLVSFKSSAPDSIAGSEGMTLAIALAAGEGEALELRSPPLVINNQFLKPTDLERLVRPTSEHELTLYSDTLQRSFLSRLEISNFGEYGKTVANFIEQQRACISPRPELCRFDYLSYWNVDKGHAVYRDVIGAKREVQGFSLQQRWPLMSGIPVASIGHPQIVSNRNQTTSISINGRLRLAADGRIWTVTQSDPAKIDFPLAIFAIENDLYVAVELYGQLRLNKFETLPDGRLPVEMSVVARWSEERVHLILSSTYAKSGVKSAPPQPENLQSSTVYYVLYPQASSENLSLGRRVAIDQSYYGGDELSARLYIKDKTYGFDNLTPAQGSRPLYLQERDPSTPFYNLSNTNVESEKKYIYTNPSREETLATGLVYREYAYRAAGTNPTGLHFQSGDGKNAPIYLAGSLIRPEGKDSADLLRQGTPFVSSTFGSLSAKVFATDPTNRRAEKGFTLALHLTGTKVNQSWSEFVPIAAFNFPIQNLLAMRLVAGTKEHAHELYFVTFTPDKTTIYPVTLDASTNQVSVVTGSHLPEAQISPDEFVQRLVHDQKGQLYFIRTPGISPNSREFQVLNVQTFATLFPKREHGVETTFDFKTNMEDLFHSLSDESTLSWKVQPFRHEQEPSEQNQNENTVSELAKSQLFGKFQEILSESADSAQPIRRRIVLVPEEVKALALPFVKQLYLAQSQSEVPAGNLFNRFNRKLGLYVFDKVRATPDAVFENFQIAQSKKGEQSVIVADLADMIEVDRPVSSGAQHPFILKIPQAHSGADGKSQLYYDEVTPHVFYLMAAGAPVEFENFRQAIPEPLANTILVGTRKEYQQIIDRASYEAAAGVSKAFEVIELPLPTLASKSTMLGDVMARPEIQGLGFEFDASEIADKNPADKAERQLKVFEYAITRVDAIAKPRGENAFSAFIQFMNLFSEKILTDPVVRYSRRIDRSFIERILKLQFNLTLNLADLPPDDPRKILSEENAVFRLQKAGMLGEFALKAEVIRLGLAQLNHDPARVMPSTWIWAGNPGTGKTRTWQALVKMLNLKLFDPKQKAELQQANGFYLDPVRVKKGDQAAVDKVIEELNDFISTPSGSAGYIFFDDLSFADDALGKAIVQWIRALQQSSKGTFKVERKQGAPVTIAVQNLTIGIAMNFTDNKDTLAQYTGDDVTTLVAKIVATGSRFGMDKSFVDRFGGVYNFDKFHLSVKEPSLNEALLEAAQKKLARTGEYVVVDPALVRSAAEAWPDMAARPFLSKTTNAIMGQPDHLQSARTKVFAVIPRSEEDTKKTMSSAAERLQERGTSAWGQESSEVDVWTNGHARVIELSEGTNASLMLMRLMVPSFRSPILESLIYAMQMDPRLKADRMSRSFFQAPALMAAFDHIARAETIPLSQLKIDETQFNVKTKSELEEFKTLLNDLSVGQSPFVIEFPTTGARLDLWSEIGINGAPKLPVHSRRDVLLDYTNKIHAVVERHLLRTLYVQNLAQLENVEGWLRALPEKVPLDSEKLGLELNELLFEFLRDFSSPDLAESKAGSDRAGVDPYAAVRFFFMALDQAIIRLPWTNLSIKMTKALELITQDLVLGQSVGVQNWLFNPEDRASLLKPTTTNLIREMIEFNSTVRETKQADRQAKARSFDSICEKVLSPGGR